MKITHLKTNHIVNPLGFAIENPTFSWIVNDTFDKAQTAAQVLFSRDGDFEQIIFDSGKVDGTSINSLVYRPPIMTKPRTRYFWKVRVWGETENAESDTVWFETSKIDEDWRAEWITPDCEDNRTHPILYRYFDLPSRAVSARVVLPDAQMGKILINDHQLSEGEQIGNNVELTVGAGCYKIEYQVGEKDAVDPTHDPNSHF